MKINENLKIKEKHQTQNQVQVHVQVQVQVQGQVDKITHTRRRAKRGGGYLAEFPSRTWLLGKDSSQDTKKNLVGIFGLDESQCNSLQCNEHRH